MIQGFLTPTAVSTMTSIAQDASLQVISLQVWALIPVNKRLHPQPVMVKGDTCVMSDPPPHPGGVAGVRRKGRVEHPQNTKQNLSYHLTLGNCPSRNCKNPLQRHPDWSLKQPLQILSLPGLFVSHLVQSQLTAKSRRRLSRHSQHHHTRRPEPSYSQAPRRPGADQSLPCRAPGAQERPA